MLSSIKSLFGAGDTPALPASAPTPTRAAAATHQAPPEPQAASWAHVTVGAFEGFLTNSKVPVLVDFTASWCGPCRQLGPQLDAYGTKHTGKVRVVKVDMDQAPHLGQRFRVTGLPTVVLFKGGKEVGRFMGVKNERQIQAFVDPFLG